MTGRDLCAGLSGGLKLGPGIQETLRKAIDAAAVQQPTSAHRLHLRIKELWPSTEGPV
jgi:hypothetical protein